VDAHPWYRGPRFAALALALASVVVLLAASAATPAPATQPNIVTQARARLAKLAVPRDAIGKPKSTPKWKRGMKVWVISCDQSLTGCWIAAKSLQTATKQLGWTVTVFDGHSNPSEWVNGVRQAIAADADVIMLDSVDCSAVRAPLAQAKAAHIVIYGLNSIDCSDPGAGGGPSLIDYTGVPKGYKSHPQFIRDWGRMKADYVIAKTNGRAKVITFSQADVLGIKYESEAIKQELAKCKGCQVVANVSFTLPDFATGGVFKKFQTALLQHPEANAVVTLYDAIIILAVAPALQQAGRTKMIVAGGEGDPANLELIRRNKLRSCAFAVDVQDSGYPIADNMIRLLAHKRPVDQATAVLLIDKQHNIKRIHGYYNGFFPYAKYYSKLWRKAK
jgi:ribose transport system substrate-binding protein